MGTHVATRTLNQRQTDFVGFFVETGDAHQAALLTGYAEGTARTAGTEILALPHIALAIARAARLRLARGVPLALNTLEHLVGKAQSEKVRLDAAKAVLDRAGLVPPKDQEDRSTIATPLHEMTTEDLRAMVHRLEDELVGRAKTVTSEPDSIADVVG
jgi:phage terminase small subunit